MGAWYLVNLNEGDIIEKYSSFKKAKREYCALLNDLKNALANPDSDDYGIIPSHAINADWLDFYNTPTGEKIAKLLDGGKNVGKNY